MLIRAVTAKDFPALDSLIAAAFDSTAFGYQGEADLVRSLHNDGDALVSLVAEEDGRIIGHAMFSRMRVEADGTALCAAGLAPVAVLPDSHSQGIGSTLIRQGLIDLCEQGVQISFVLGHPAYYPRFGYRAEHAQPFASPYAGSHFMALWLDKSVKAPESGRADYASAFSV
ncbi:MAG: N-acetyltransferase [Sphingopyxis sp.]